MEIEKEKKELAVRNRSYRKSNQFINARGSSTLLCQKLFAVGMSRITLDETQHVIATIYSSELRSLFGTTSGSMYSRIEELCEKQEGRSTLFDWQILLKDKENEQLEAHAVVSDAYFRNGVLKIRYNDYLTPMIHNLRENFTTLSLAETISMKSIHSLRLSEILKSRYDHDSYVSKKNGVFSYTYDLIELKMELGIVKVDGNKKIKRELSKENPDYRLVEDLIEAEGRNRYRSYKDFNLRVLERAKEEINEKTELHIDYEPIRQGKKAVGVIFFVEKRQQDTPKKLSKEEKNAVLDEVTDLLYGDLRASECMELCEYADYDIDRLRGACRYYRSYETPVKEPIAFLKTAVKEGYGTDEEFILPSHPIQLTVDTSGMI